MNDRFVQRIGVEVEEIKAAGLFKTERIITSPQGAEITVNGKTVLNFCANNYLGLSSHPDVIAAAHRAIDARGYGMSSVRFICGTQDIHKELEEKISQFLGTEDTIIVAVSFIIFQQYQGALGLVQPVESALEHFFEIIGGHVMNFRILAKFFPQRYPLHFADMINHLVISDGKQIGFGPIGVHIGAVSPHFFKRGLHHIPGIFFMSKIFQDEAIHVIGPGAHAFIIFSFGHKQQVNGQGLKYSFGRDFK